MRLRAVNAVGAGIGNAAACAKHTSTENHRIDDRAGVIFSDCIVAAEGLRGAHGVADVLVEGCYVEGGCEDSCEDG